MVFFRVLLLSKLTFNCRKCNYALLGKCVSNPSVPNGRGSVKLFITALDRGSFGKERQLRDLSGRERLCLGNVLLPDQCTEAVCHYKLLESPDNTAGGEVKTCSLQTCRLVGLRSTVSRKEKQKLDGVINESNQYE